MSRTHILLAAVTDSVLTLDAGVAMAAPTTPAPAPGPQRPIEHLGPSGGLLQVTSGDQGCHGAGVKVLSFPVPRNGAATRLPGGAGAPKPTAINARADRAVR